MEERFKNYGGTAEEQAVKWVGELTGTSEELESKGYAMQDCLKSGIVLCALIERLGGKRIKDTEDLYKQDSQNLRNVELCLRNLSKLAYTLDNYHGPCFVKPPKGAKARGVQKQLKPATALGSRDEARAGRDNVGAGTGVAEREEIGRLRRELESKERELAAQAEEIRLLRSELEQHKQQNKTQSSTGLRLDLPNPPNDDFERLLYSNPGDTPRLDRDQQNPPMQTEIAPSSGPAWGPVGCSNCASLEAALQSAEAALDDVYHAYVGEGATADGDSTLESLAHEISRKVCAGDAAI